MATIDRPTTFDQSLEAFATELDRYTQTSVDGSHYVRISALSGWMREATEWEGRYISRAQLLTNAAYSQTEPNRRQSPPIICEKGPKCCIIVLSILLDLSLGHRVHEFARRNVVDCNLPQNLATLKSRFKSLGTDGENLAHIFSKRQWKFSPAQFSYEMDEDFDDDRVIPICRKSHLNTGGTADVCQIVVQEEFVDSKLRLFLAEDVEAKYDDKVYGMCYVFALKTFKSNFQYYYDEKNAYDILQENKGMLRRFGYYSQRVIQLAPSTTRDTPQSAQKSQWKDTMNILLEYGTFDLRTYFGHISPPILPSEIIRFWMDMFEISDAVQGIHEFRSGGIQYNGLHADIKPRNIIMVRGKFKLADPGSARFMEATTGKPLAPPEILVYGGTDTYGAPEGRNGTMVHQTIDTWSLGCVFSVAATWVVMGWEGVSLYSKVREKALGVILRDIQDNNHPILVSQKLSARFKPEKMDCFHDGSRLLREVHDWHQLLRSSVRRTDPLTEQVLDLIDHKVLIKEPEKRIRLPDLCADLEQLVMCAKKAARDREMAEGQEMRKSIERTMKLLKTIDKE